VILVAGHGAGDERVRPRRLPPQTPEAFERGLKRLESLLAES
jgi:hypothetical protein